MWQITRETLIAAWQTLLLHQSASLTMTSCMAMCYRNMWQCRSRAGEVIM